MAVDTHNGRCRVFFVFNSSLLDPGFYLTDRDIKVSGYLIFIYFVRTDKFPNLVKKVSFLTGRTDGILV